MRVTRFLSLFAAFLAVFILTGSSIAPLEAPEIEEVSIMRIGIGDYEFQAALESNPTAEALKEQLPLELNMSELNGNEKYNYLDFSLPTDSHCPGQIQAGDIMLYGDSCLVVFYESFSTVYSYTRIGHIEDTADLRAAAGSGSVQMRFETAE